MPLKYIVITFTLPTLGQKLHIGEASFTHFCCQGYSIIVNNSLKMIVDNSLKPKFIKLGLLF